MIEFWEWMILPAKLVVVRRRRPEIAMAPAVDGGVLVRITLALRKAAATSSISAKNTKLVLSNAPSILMLLITLIVTYCTYFQWC